MNKTINKIKKYFIVYLLLFLLILTGCTKGNESINFKQTDNFKTLNDVEVVDKDYLSYLEANNELTSLQTASLNEFTNVTSKELFKEEINYIYSPISLYMALSMLAQGADNDTLNEILSLLQGSSNDTLDEINNTMQLVFNHNSYSNKLGLAQMANSIWIRKGFPVKDEFVNKLSDYYYANAYQTNFDDDAKQNIVDWINHYTRNLLDYKKDSLIINPDIVMLLINTIYFDNKWKEEFDKANNYEDLFYGTVEKNVEYMRHTISSFYKEMDNCEVFYDYFNNQNKIKFIFPKEESSVFECLNSDVLLDSKNDLYLQCSIDLSIPKFEVKSSYDLNEPLQRLGLNSMFTYLADFSKISDEDIYVSYVRQDAGIILSEEGVKAAAVTIIGNECTSAGPEELFLRIRLDRPFIYVIYDEYNVPLFVGVINRL